MTEWDPAVSAVPVEWVIRGLDQEPSVLIRRLDFGNPNRPETWYRVVTWAHESKDRRLIGYWRTLTDAAHAAKDWQLAERSRRHSYAARRRPLPPQPDPRELLKYWREHGNVPPVV